MSLHTKQTILRRIQNGEWSDVLRIMIYGPLTVFLLAAITLGGPEKTVEKLKRMAISLSPW